MKQQHEFKEMVTIFGIPGVCNVEVSISFGIHPNKFSPGMLVIAQEEIKNAVYRIVEKAKKEK